MWAGCVAWRGLSRLRGLLLRGSEGKARRVLYSTFRDPRIEVLPFHEVFSAVAERIAICFASLCAGFSAADEGYY